MSQLVWHVKEPSLFNNHECRVLVNICSPSLEIILVAKDHSAYILQIGRMHSYAIFIFFQYIYYQSRINIFRTVYYLNACTHNTEIIIHIMYLLFFFHGIVCINLIRQVFSPIFRTGTKNIRDKMECLNRKKGSKYKAVKEEVLKN